MAVDTCKQKFQKNLARGFQKVRFLDIKKWKEKTTMMIRVLKKYSGGGATLPDFLHVGVRDVWPNAQRKFRPGEKFCSGVSKIAVFRHI